jgi:hypothetical protein
MTKITIIPVGYRLTVVSWENDGDNYNTKVLEGLTREVCQYYVDLCKLLSLDIGKRNSNFSNLYDPSDSEREELIDALMPIASKHLHTAIPLADIEDVANREYVWDYVMGTMYDLGLSGGEFYTRVCDGFTVQYVPES